MKTTPGLASSHSVVTLSVPVTIAIAIGSANTTVTAGVDKKSVGLAGVQKNRTADSGGFEGSKGEAHREAIDQRESNLVVDQVGGATEELSEIVPTEIPGATKIEDLEISPPTLARYKPFSKNDSLGDLEVFSDVKVHGRVFEAAISEVEGLPHGRVVPPAF